MRESDVCLSHVTDFKTNHLPSASQGLRQEHGRLSSPWPVKSEPSGMVYSKMKAATWCLTLWNTLTAIIRLFSGHPHAHSRVRRASPCRSTGDNHRRCRKQALIWPPTALCRALSDHLNMTVVVCSIISVSDATVSNYNNCYLCEWWEVLRHSHSPSIRPLAESKALRGKGASKTILP